jgi:hypothetical protein
MQSVKDKVGIDVNSCQHCWLVLVGERHGMRVKMKMKPRLETEVKGEVKHT